MFWLETTRSSLNHSLIKYLGNFAINWQPIDRELEQKSLKTRANVKDKFKNSTEVKHTVWMVLVTWLNLINRRALFQKCMAMLSKLWPEVQGSKHLYKDISFCLLNLSYYITPHYKNRDWWHNYSCFIFIDVHSNLK